MMVVTSEALGLRAAQVFPSGSPDREPRTLEPQIEAEVTAAYLRFWEKEYRPSKPGTIDLKAVEEQQAGLRRELKAAQVMIDGGRTLAEQNPGMPVRVLCDNDESTVCRVWDPSFGFVLRPAMAVVGRVLSGEIKDFKFGSLTTQPQKHLDAELESPTFTAPIAGLMDRNLVFSSTDSALAETAAHRVPADSASHEAHINSVRRIVSPRIIHRAVVSGHIQKPAEWFDRKLPMLELISNNNPGVALGYVDNIPPAAVIDPKHPRLRGIFLGTDAQFFNVNGEEF